MSWTDQTQQDCAERRSLVLKYPDISARLTERPLHLSRPENWTGYLPPAMWREQHNHSAVLEQLLSILHDATEREKETD